MRGKVEWWVPPRSKLKDKANKTWGECRAENEARGSLSRMWVARDMFAGKSMLSVGHGPLPAPDMRYCMGWPELTDDVWPPNQCCMSPAYL
jgi:hypothetical protein